MRQDNEAFKAAGPDAAALDFNNCVDVQMDMFQEEGVVLDELPPAQLHLKLGATNKMNHGLCTAWPAAVEWAEVKLDDV